MHSRSEGIPETGSGICDRASLQVVVATDARPLVGIHLLVDRMEDLTPMMSGVDPKARDFR